MNRTRRLRKNPSIRSMVRETKLSVYDFIYPLFIVEGENIKREISSMKGVYHFSVDKVLEEIKEIMDLGIKSIILFGIPDKKTIWVLKDMQLKGLFKKQYEPLN